MFIPNTQLDADPSPGGGSSLDLITAGRSVRRLGSSLDPFSAAYASTTVVQIDRQKKNIFRNT